jgi:hypothetical protein
MDLTSKSAAAVRASRALKNDEARAAIESMTDQSGLSLEKML